MARDALKDERAKLRVKFKAMEAELSEEFPYLAKSGDTPSAAAEQGEASVQSASGDSKDAEESSVASSACSSTSSTKASRDAELETVITTLMQNLKIMHDALLDEAMKAKPHKTASERTLISNAEKMLHDYEAALVKT